MLTAAETPTNHSRHLRRRLPHLAHLRNRVAAHPRQAGQKTRSQDRAAEATRRKRQRKSLGARDKRDRDTVGDGAREEERRALPVTLEPLHKQEKLQPLGYSLHGTSHASLVRRLQHHRLRAPILRDPRSSRQPGETAVHRDHRDRQTCSSNSLRSLRRRSHRPSEVADHGSDGAARLHFLHRRCTVRRPRAGRRGIHARDSPRWHQCYRLHVSLRCWVRFWLELTVLHHHFRDLPFADADGRDGCGYGRALWQSIWVAESGALDAARRLDAPARDVLVLLGDYVDWHLLGVGLVAGDGQHAAGKSSLYFGRGGSER